MTISSSSLRPGDDLRHYRIEQQIGAGGMGIVYEARHHTLDYRVAIKEFAFPSPTSEEDTKARALHQAALDAFIAEARVLITLDHDDIPAGGADIPKVYDLFQEKGSWFLVMEFISGKTLDLILEERGGAVSVEEGVQWGESILKTLTFLHRQEPPVIHRDIKPGNLKLNEQGRIVILDFGVAKSGSMIAREQRTSSTSQFVSFHYAPPEQLRGRGTDARSDIFALAGTLYLLLTGEHPPDAQERVNTTLLDRQPDPLRLANELNPIIPRHVAQALQQALAIQPNQRFESAEAFRKSLADPWGQAADYSGLMSATAPTGHVKTGDVRATLPPVSPTFPVQSLRSATPTEDIVYRPVSTPLTPEPRRSPFMGVMAGLLLILLLGGAVGLWQGWIPLPVGMGAGVAQTGDDDVVIPTPDPTNVGLAVVNTITPEPTFTPNNLPTAVSSTGETDVSTDPTSTRLPTQPAATPTETPTETPSPTATATEIVIVPTPTATETPRPVKPSATTAALFATNTPVPSSTPNPTATPQATATTPPPPPSPTSPPASPPRPPIVVRDTPAWWQIGVNDLITLTWDGGGGPIAANEGVYLRVYQNGVFQRNIEIPYIEWNSQNFYPFRGWQVSGGADRYGRFTVYMEIVDVNGQSLTRSQSWDFEVGP